MAAVPVQQRRRVLPLYEEPPPFAVDLVEPRAPDPTCTSCELHERIPTAKSSRKHVNHACMSPESATGARGGILVIGESPGTADYEERDKDGNDCQRPFRALWGKEVRVLVHKFWKGPVAFDLSVRCFIGREGLKNMKPIEACRPFLAHTLRDAQPTRIITLGSQSAYAVLGRNPIPFTNRRGYALHRVDYAPNPIPVFNLMSPTSNGQNPVIRRFFTEDLKWAIEANPRVPPWNARVRLVETVEDAKVAIAYLRSRKRGVAWDVETAGLQYDPSFRIVCLSLCARGEADAFQFTVGACADSSIREVLLEYLCDAKSPKGGANIKYDMTSVYSAWGRMPRGMTFDTRLWRKLLDPDASAKLEHMAELIGMGGMKEENAEHREEVSDRVTAILQAERRIEKQTAKATERLADGTRRKTKPIAVPPPLSTLGVDALLEPVVRDPAHEKEKWLQALLPEDVLYRYNSRDAVATAALADVLEERLNAVPEIRRVWDVVTRGASDAIAQLEAWGVAASRENILLFDRHLTGVATSAKARLDGYFPGVNWKSAPQIRKVLFTDLGLKSVKVTDTQLESTDNEVLQYLRASHPLCDALIEYRRAMKLKGTYAAGDDGKSGMLAHVRPDGRIHTSILLDGARSGRTSSQDPNLQNIPRPGTPVSKMARDCFVAPNGTVLVQFDYCLAPGTKVLRSDLRWANIEDVHPGDELVGFDEELGPSCKMRPSKVEIVRKLERKRYRITTDRGEVVCSAMHGWVRASHQGKVVRKWTPAHELERGDTLAFFADPWEVGKTWEDGWMSGFLDGEGWVSSNGAGFGQNEGATLNRAVDYLHSKGFDLGFNMNKNGCMRVTPKGERQSLKMLGMFRPFRLLPQADRLWDGTRSWSKRSRPATILSIEELPPGEVVGIQTSTRTLIANGFLTHNSQLELRVAAMFSNDPLMVEMFRSGKDFHQLTAEMVAPMMWKKKASEVTKDDRSKVKPVVFGVLYGKGDDALAKDLHCSKAEATRMREAIMGKFVKLQSWTESKLAESLKTAESWTWWDGQRARRRSLWQILDANKASASVARHSSWNTPIQGTASEYCIASLIQSVQWVLDDQVPAKVVLPVHDSIMFEVRRDAVPEVIHTVRNIMQSHTMMNDVPLIADVEIGSAWGSLEKLEKTEWKGCV